MHNIGDFNNIYELESSSSKELDEWNLIWCAY